MAIAQFPILSFAQANPGLMGAAAGQELYKNMIQNMYAPSMAQQTLEQAMYKTLQDQAAAKYASPMAQAKLATEEAQPEGILAKAAQERAIANVLYPAQAGLMGAQTQGTLQDVLLKQLYSRQLQDIVGGGQSLQQATNGTPAGLQPTSGQYVEGTYLNPKQQQTLNDILGRSPEEVQKSTDQAKQEVLGGATLASPQQVSTQTGYGIPGQQMANQPMGQLSPYQQKLWRLADFKAVQEGKTPPSLLGQIKGIETQATTGVQKYNEYLDAAHSSADDAIQMNNLIKDFSQAYDHSKLVGPTKGYVPSSLISARGYGDRAAYLAAAASGHDFTPEQQADNAAQNMQQMILKLMKTNRLTNYELSFAGNLKLNRSMTPETKNMLADWLTAKSDRLIEEQKFLNAAKNNGVDLQTASTLWNEYNNQRPVYDFQNKTINTGFKDSWNDYLTPQAVSSAQNGQPFVPENLKKEDYKYLRPDQLMQLKQRTSK